MFAASSVPFPKPTGSFEQTLRRSYRATSGQTSAGACVLSFERERKRFVGKPERCEFLSDSLSHEWVIIEAKHERPKRKADEQLFGRQSAG